MCWDHYLLLKAFCASRLPNVCVQLAHNFHSHSGMDVQVVSGFRGFRAAPNVWRGSGYPVQIVRGVGRKVNVRAWLPRPEGWLIVTFPPSTPPQLQPYP